MTDCPMAGTYSFKDVAFTIAGGKIEGFAEGNDAILVRPFKDAGVPKVGADGAAIVSYSASEAATVIIKLMRYSPWNKKLASLLALQRTGANVGFAIGILDTRTGETAGCTRAFVVKAPERQEGEEAVERTWEIFCACWREGEVTYRF